MTAIIGGTLELDHERGCVLLDGKPVVWPAGTTLSSDPLELHLPGDLTARAGHRITGGGGEVPSTRIRETAIRIEGDVAGALGCNPSAREVLVFWARGGDIRVSPIGSGDRLAWANEPGRASPSEELAATRERSDRGGLAGRRAGGCEHWVEQPQ